MRGMTTTRKRQLEQAQPRDSELLEEVERLRKELGEARAENKRLQRMIKSKKE